MSAPLALTGAAQHSVRRRSRMPSLTTQRQARAVKKLPFCYVCTREFAEGEERTDDHVPPRACFSEADRDFPLQLPTHQPCNTDRNLTDETIAQVVSLIHTGRPELGVDRLKISIVPSNSPEAPLGVLTNVDVHAEIRRWIRGFHAALYQQPLSLLSRFAIQAPFPAAQLTNSDPVVGPPRPQDFKFVETIKLNRVAQTLDRIVCYNGKLRYECVWDQADNGQWICIFALDLYDWKNLGDDRNFPARGCVGSYFTSSEPAPALSTRGTQLSARVPNMEPLNPFGE